VAVVRRASLLVGIVLVVVWIGWRGPHLVDDVRYAVATPWPGADLALGEDGALEINGRRILVEALMNVDCMPSVRPIPLPLPDCHPPAFAIRLSTKTSDPTQALPRVVHALVVSEGSVWETDLTDVDRERTYDATFEKQYAAAFAQRESPNWDAGRAIQVTAWLEDRGRLYRVVLPPSVISHSS
jgi:hypothetical protein